MNETGNTDRRAADWIYFVSLSKEAAILVVGSGSGHIPIALAKLCARVYVVDSSWDRITVLNHDVRQQGVGNICIIHVSRSLDLPFLEDCFEFIAVQDVPESATRATSFRALVRSVGRLLKKHGTLQLSLANRLALRGWRVPRALAGASSCRLHTYLGYRRILRREGFRDIQLYAPLPEHRGIPMFYVPLEDRAATKYFLRELFPLCDMVSPEIKRAYAGRYALARIGVRLALTFRLAGLMRCFVPGFCVIAKSR